MYQDDEVARDWLAQGREGIGHPLFIYTLVSIRLTSFLFFTPLFLSCNFFFLLGEAIPFGCYCHTFFWKGKRGEGNQMLLSCMLCVFVWCEARTHGACSKLNVVEK